MIKRAGLYDWVVFSTFKEANEGDKNQCPWQKCTSWEHPPLILIELFTRKKWVKNCYDLSNPDLSKLAILKTLSLLYRFKLFYWRFQWSLGCVKISELWRRNTQKKCWKSNLCISSFKICGVIFSRSTFCLVQPRELGCPRKLVTG